MKPICSVLPLLIHLLCSTLINLLSRVFCDSKLPVDLDPFSNK
uniref:Uncharacterized protein n=1 Tax=Arundo donax TaxID=35708 RepID=A0A0A8ZAG9_ARUDO